uniref:Uncharacterized protein n=1 Tax=Rhizophora mucronata TaxID=61149 RepID=A0A2P2IH82_RHIMU
MHFISAKELAIVKYHSSNSLYMKFTFNFIKLFFIGISTNKLRALGFFLDY